MFVGQDDGGTETGVADPAAEGSQEEEWLLIPFPLGTVCFWRVASGTGSYFH